MSKKTLKRLLVWGLSLLVLGLIGIFSFYFSVKWGAFGPLPADDELSDIRNATATLVYSADEKLIGKIFSENRTNANLNELPQHLLDALVATEDARFYEHEGVDNRSVLRVIVKSILLQDESAGGGSTLTQQLAKNLYGRRDFGFLTLPVNKVKEIILAQRLEELYTKEQILEFYLNTVPFSENTYGIEAASQRFFSKKPLALKPEESAVLIGMLKASTYYNPRLHPNHALGRRNVVLHQMVRYGYLNKATYDSLKVMELKLNYNKLGEDSRAPYFMAHVKKRALELIKDNLADDGEPYNLEQDGLKIYTTLNLQMQQAADEAIKKHMSRLQRLFDAHWSGRKPWGAQTQVFDSELIRSRSYQNLKRRNLPDDSLQYYLNQKHPVQVYAPQGDTVLEMSIKDSVAYYLKLLHCGFLAMAPRSGQVLAWSGGLNQRFLPYDHVLARRQAASTFKPVVYAAALSQGADPCRYISNEQRVYEEYENWTPRNYDNKYGGFYSMKGALTKSVNVAAVQTLFDAGINNVLMMARQLGVSSRLPSDPSVALGTGSVSLQEMVQAYAVFANGGFALEPYFIERIENNRGEVLYEHKQPDMPRRVIGEDVAAMINEMLQSVVNNGTATRLRNVYGLQNSLAGKTGTAQNYTDGWFIGYTPKLVAGVWVGASSPVVHFRSGTYGSGSAMALPVFGEFFKTINRSSSLNNYTRARFDDLPEDLQYRMDCEDFREENLFDSFFGIFKDEEGRPISPEKEEEQEQPQKKAKPQKKGFLERLFKRNR
jgi:penicillin-binding protein 1A